MGFDTDPPVHYNETSPRDRSIGKKIRAAGLAALLFLIFGNPVAFDAVDKIYSFAFNGEKELVNLSGNCPSLKGVIVNSVLVFVVFLFLMS